MNLPGVALDDRQWLEPRSVFSGSFDLRHSGYKIAPVDANLYPAGWHQICESSRPLAIERLRQYVAHEGWQGKSAVLLAESFTRNAPYLENLYVLRELLAAVFERVEVVMYLDALPEAGHNFQTTRGLLPVSRFVLGPSGAPRIRGEELTRSVVILATDLSGGDSFLDGLSVPLSHPRGLGWDQRTKETFFALYNPLAEAAARAQGLDPWSLMVETETVSISSLEDAESLRKLGTVIDAMTARIGEQYRARGIADVPFVAVKSVAGTFGRGVLMLTSAEELEALPLKVRRNLAAASPQARPGQPLAMLVQEGIYTRDLVRGCPSEPVLYALGGALVGGFYRSHCGKDPATNLNSPGMVFAAMCAADNVADGHPTELSALQGVYYAVGALALDALAAEVAAAN